ncbi:MGH1-like glycoside hydrolase domain-containing protein [Aureibacillus halotolerans]|uniref:Glycosyl hydrolase family 63 n=1 Tax=Aureibacillus halotolerans TaxID=1508390 RepID=A0A4R6TU62_9BACI|nr:trehalase family glycosidase [Aureibacillus halotolerans]TDQ36112.1 glycosyl hydrolase family 63 [Aureibacillus halotolerans]
MKHLAGTHDQKGLPAWGPYTKKYIGISHIANAERGMRFDLSLFPGFYRRKVDVPNVMWESGYHPWEAAPDLSWYTHRHELEWKDRVFADISYAVSTEARDVRSFRCKFENRTDDHQNVVLHAMASLHFPQVQGHGEPLLEVRPELPQGAVWMDALDYESLFFANPRAADQLTYDGFYRGEQRGQGLVGGSALLFGRDHGDRVKYVLELEEELPQASLMIRYRLKQGHRLELDLSGPTNERLQLEGTGDIIMATISLGKLSAGRHELMLQSESVGLEELAELDGFVLVDRRIQEQVQFSALSLNAHPQRLPGPLPNTMLLKYEDSEHYYGLLWAFDDYEVREFHCDELDRFMRHTVHQHVSTVLKNDGDGHFTNVFMRPIPLEPHSSTIINGMVCCGSEEEVWSLLRDFDASPEACEAAFAGAKSLVQAADPNPSGEVHLFGQQLMQAVLAMNVVYPVYTKRSYIRHYTPGRWWDSLYTWDSGFIGIGLAQLDPQRAVECLNAYVTEPGDPHAAFIHHGSMVPVQHYLFHELWGKTQSRELLTYFYPRLKQYYQFFAGKTGGSTTALLPSGLLNTWDYFYNSGGWDDYPPQVEVHRSGRTAEAAPVSVTCHAIRIAKILKMAATSIGGLEEDIAAYEADIKVMSNAVLGNAWDEESGYFGYVLHDEAGRPKGLLRHEESGQNYNMGLDGLYPLVAGICTPEQERRLTSYLGDEQRLWTPIGLTTVDRKAPYYKKEGYWNGAVWLPHQWFYWKTLLGLGQSELAHRIAETALELWSKETGNTYNCYEHFIVQSGRGAGWHHFGGLSAPVLAWFAAYHRPGTFTCGYDVWVERTEFSEALTSMRAKMSYFGTVGRPHNVLVCLKAGRTYRATWNGEPVQAEMVNDGLLDVRLHGEPIGELSVMPV